MEFQPTVAIGRATEASSIGTSPLTRVRPSRGKRGKVGRPQLRWTNTRRGLADRYSSKCGPRFGGQVGGGKQVTRAETDSHSGMDLLPLVSASHMSIHISVHMSVHMSVYMSIYMSVYMSIHMSKHKSICVSTRTPCTFLYTRRCSCLVARSQACLCMCFCTCLPHSSIILHARMLHACLHACLRTCPNGHRHRPAAPKPTARARARCQGPMCAAETARTAAASCAENAGMIINRSANILGLTAAAPAMPFRIWPGLMDKMRARACGPELESNPLDAQRQRWEWDRELQPMIVYKVRPHARQPSIVEATNS